MAVDELVGFVVRGLVDHPDDVRVNRIEGDATTMLELSVHPDDVELVRGDGGETLRHLKSLVAASGGRRKAVLELLDNGAEASGAGDDAEE